MSMLHHQHPVQQLFGHVIVGHDVAATCGKSHTGSCLECFQFCENCRLGIALYLCTVHLEVHDVAGCGAPLILKHASMYKLRGS